MEDKIKLVGKEKKILEIEKKTKELDLKFEILKNAGKLLHQGRSKIFDFMLCNEKKYTITLMSETLGVSRFSYHKWKKKPLSAVQKRKILIKKEITSIFFVFRRRYGSERITVELRKSGYKLSTKTVKKYMKEMGLSSLVKKN